MVPGSPSGPRWRLLESLRSNLSRLGGLKIKLPKALDTWDTSHA